MKTHHVVPFLLAAAPLCAQSIPVPLTYNFNGIVHAGESGLPDDPNGYRSISDRGLDWTGGVPNDQLLAQYQLIGTAGVLDMVHLGNRNTVDGGNRQFDATANGDDIGIQPNWLTNVDQTTPQTSVVSPLPVLPNATVSFLYQISNGGGSFDVRFDFASGGAYTATLSGPDWFGGVYAGTDSTDSGQPGAPLSITEGVVDMTPAVGEVITQISFENASNTNAGYGIFACNINYAASPRRVNQIALNYNFNGIVHAGEAGLPDDLAGFRSISDRALDFSAGVPADPLLAPYRIVDTAGALDIVHLGNRNTVDNGTWTFQGTANGDDIGVQPAWLPNVDQSQTQTTTLVEPILLDGLSTASLLFQISNGGGAFDVRFDFASGTSTTATINGGDWFGGAFPGTDRVDFGNPGANLSILERRIDLSGSNGEILTAISFENRSNLIAGYAVLAMNVSGCLSCANAGGVANLGGGTGLMIATNANGNLGCDLDWVVNGATPGSPLGFFLFGVASSPTPLMPFFPACSGTVFVGSPDTISAPIDAMGSATLVLPGSSLANPAYCGATAYAQFAELVPGACPVRLSDAIGITLGN